MSVLAVQTGLYGVLTAAFAGVSPAAVPVYDHVPQDAAYPFVAIGEIASTADDLLTDEQSRLVVPVAIHTRYRGQKKSHELAALARTALHERLFEIADGAISQCRVERVAVDRDSDGLTYVNTLIVAITLEH